MLKSFTFDKRNVSLFYMRVKNLVRKFGTPIYVYNFKTIRERYLDLVENIFYPKLRIHYAMKANSNIEILKLLRRLGAKVETVSGEKYFWL